MNSFVKFILASVVVGLIAALLALYLVGNRNFHPVANGLGRLPPEAQSYGPVSYAAAVQAAAPSVVNIYTTKITIEQQGSLFDDPIFRRFFGDRFSSPPRKKRANNLGSGVIISEEGFILTNHHVIDGADEIRVVLADGTTLAAEIAGTDPDTDLAVIKSDRAPLPAITVGSSSHLRVGDVVLAIGNPFGVGQTVTLGIVSATGRNQLGINTFENFIQTDAAINPGNSGGALINAYGELVGINTAIFSKTGGSDGIGFAIPITLAKGVMDQILRKGRVVRGWLGIAGRDITAEMAEAHGLRTLHGVLVSAVLEGGPADSAGIEPGDIITRIGNQAPSSSQEILSIISGLEPGTTVKIRGWRGDREFQLEATVSERPSIGKSN